MGRFLLGLIVVPVVLAVAVGVVLILDQFGIVSYPKAVLQPVGSTLGIQNLAENYDLGKKRSALLESRDQELRKAEAEVKSRQTVLAQKMAEFEAAKTQWEKDHPLTPVAAANSASGLANSSKAPPPSAVKADPKEIQFLANIGGMKPAKAAAVIEKLAPETVYRIFDQLDARQVSKIMENLPADLVAKLTQGRMLKNGNP
jgi:flagellar motility protein MotE (MotC chaperone)